MFELKSQRSARSQDFPRLERGPFERVDRKRYDSSKIGQDWLLQYVIMTVGSDKGACGAKYASKKA